MECQLKKLLGKVGTRTCATGHQLTALLSNSMMVYWIARVLTDNRRRRFEFPRCQRVFSNDILRLSIAIILITSCDLNAWIIKLRIFIMIHLLIASFLIDMRLWFMISACVCSCFSCNNDLLLNLMFHSNECSRKNNQQWIIEKCKCS